MENSAESPKKNAYSSGRNTHWLIDEYGSLIMAICLAHTRNIHDAEDIAQEVMLKAFQKIETIRDPNRIRQWLAQIARRSCIDFYRKSRLVRTVSLSKEAGDSIANNDEQHQRFERLYGSISHLPKKNRQVIYLFYMDKLTCSQIADMLKISETAIRKRLCRARSELHNMLKDMDI